MAGLLSPAEDAVTATLRIWAMAPFDDITANCGTSVLAYVEAATGRTSPIRPPSRRSGVRRMMARPGYFCGFCARVVEQLGLVATSKPTRGDVGLVDLDTGLTAAICLGNGKWAARGARAVIVRAAEPLRAWRVSCPRR